MQTASQDEPVYGWSRLPSVIPFEYDADGERDFVAEIAVRTQNIPEADAGQRYKPS